MTMVRYPVTYQVLADSRLDAIVQAVGKLRKGVRSETVGEAEQSIPGWWSVTLNVSEDIGADDPEWPGDLPEQADELTMAKAEAARFGL